jgi:RNA polymerase sigma-70 factor (ECF subfamily)
VSAEGPAALWQDGAVDRHAVERAFREHRGFLWGLSYRLVGDAADADELVQETFLRALTRPPRDLERPWRPWLTRVAVNLGRDLLRRRRRRRYDGPWLPAPVPTDAAGLSGEPADPAPGPDARYDRLESVTFAFLLALEALSPAQRAVLLLRDVFDYSVREAAEALLMSEANVKTTHLRARRVMESYDARRAAPRTPDAARSGRALEQLLACLASRDAGALEALLADDVRSISDAGGEFASSRNEQVGAVAVARLCLGLQSRAGRVVRMAWHSLNGRPAVELQFDGGPAGWAPRVVMQCDTDEAGRITRLYSVMATCKLARLPAEDAGALGG